MEPLKIQLQQEIAHSAHFNWYTVIIMIPARIVRLFGRTLQFKLQLDYSIVGHTMQTQMK